MSENRKRIRINLKEEVGLYTCEEIYNKYLPQIYKFLRKKKHLPDYSINGSYDDLLQICSMTLVEGYNSYNIDKHPVAFGQYFKVMLEYKMKRTYRNEFKNRRADYKDRITGITKAVSLNSLINEREEREDKSSTYEEIISIQDERIKAKSMIFNIDIKKFMEDNLNEKEKEIIYYYYYCDYSQSEIAKIENMSQVQVSRILKRVINSMKGYFDIKGDNMEGDGEEMYKEPKVSKEMLKKELEGKELEWNLFKELGEKYNQSANTLYSNAIRWGLIKKIESPTNKKTKDKEQIKEIKVSEEDTNEQAINVDNKKCPKKIITDIFQNIKITGLQGSYVECYMDGNKLALEFKEQKMPFEDIDDVISELNNMKNLITYCQENNISEKAS